MDKQINGKRFEPYKEWERILSPEYDYTRKGLVKRIISKPIAKTKNPILKIVLQFYESSIVYMLKSIDILKNFKNVHSKNR